MLGLFLRRPADAYLFSPAEAVVERFARLRAARRIGHACGFTTEIYAEADRRKAMAAAARVG